MSMILHQLKNPGVALLIGLIFLVIVVDQGTKWVASTYLVMGNPIEVLPVLDWRLAHNSGAAFSMLSDAGGWQRWFLSAVSIIASVVFFVWMLKMPQSAFLGRYSLAFIIGGALGNFIDRAFVGHVVDFISVHWQHYYFPAFNMADSAITFGAFLMILDIIINPENHQ